MKKGAIQLRTRKLESLKSFCTSAVPCEFQNSTLSAVRSAVQGSRIAIYGEIHQAASYNASGFTLELADMVAMYDKYVDVIVIATDNIVFELGALSWITTVKKYTDKPVVVLDLFLTETQITEARHRGADAVILIAAILESGELQQLTTHAKKLGLEVIIEVQDEDEVGDAQSVPYDAICINTRNIENLAEVDMHKVHRLRPLLPAGTSIIAASGIKTNYDINRYCIGCDGVLIGSSILESQNMEHSLSYFRGGTESHPFVWVRPPAFLFPGRIVKIRSELSQAGFDIKHTFKVFNTPSVFAAMYSHKFRQRIQEGRRYYAAMEESLRQVALRGGNPAYSEVWLLSSNLELIPAYQRILRIKSALRDSESVAVTSIWVDGVEMPVQLHSIHSPGASLYHHYRDLAITSAFREHRLALSDYMRT